MKRDDSWRQLASSLCTSLEKCVLLTDDALLHCVEDFIPQDMTGVLLVVQKNVMSIALEAGVSQR